MRSKALSATLLCFLLLTVPPSTAQDIFGLKPLLRIQTDHFSIYYPEGLGDQALRLSGFADETCADLVGLLGLPEPKGRIPVLLADSELDLNGYFSPYPSARIVIYPVGAKATDSLASLGDELKEVFLHELVHALTLTRRGPLWGLLAALAGDYVVPSSWVAPDSLVEGTAVWAESLDGSSGRLNDPAALESVYLDLAGSRRRGLWSASGLPDRPGEGGLPYYYGALFADFLEKTYGPGSIARVWREASSGNFLEGFEGSLFGPGALERAVGRPAKEVWASFQAWLAAGAEARPGSRAIPQPAETLDLETRRIGPFTQGNGVLYYYDGERRAVFAKSLGAEGVRRRLFEADGYLESLRLSSDGNSLLCDWAQTDPTGKPQAISCRYDLGSGRLESLGPREIAGVGAALANLRPGGVLSLEASQGPDGEGWTYGLARLGPKVLVARVQASGKAELLDPSPYALRSLSLGEMPATLLAKLGGETPPSAADGRADDAEHPTASQALLVFSATPKGGVSRLAFLGRKDGEWRLWIQREAPGGGVHDSLEAEGCVLYRSEDGDGIQSLRRMDFGPGELDRDFESHEVAWIDLETYRDSHRAGQGSAVTPALGQDTAGETAALGPGPAGAATGRRYLFPALLSSARYPWADGEAAGLGALGEDLTGRLSWSAVLGWNYENSVPEEALALALDFGAQAFSLSLSDRSTLSAGKALRRASAALSHGASLSLLPLRNRLLFSETVWLSGLDGDYSAAEFASPSFDSTSLGARLSLAWSTMTTGAFPPHDAQGFSAKLGADFEALLGEGSGWSAFGSLQIGTRNPAIGASLYGAVSPDCSIAFLPAGRLVRPTGSATPRSSAAAAPYPSFSEYAGASSLSPWYLFGEASLRLADIELWQATGPIGPPLLPGIGLRRLVLRGGARAAAYQAGSIALPSAAFLRAEVDAALLSGILACAHLGLSAECSYAFEASLPGGGAFHFFFGAGVEY